MKLLKKLIEVSKAIKYLEKDKTNKMQGYKYLSEAKIKEVIKSKFEEQGIVFNYSTTGVREYEISATSKGTKQFNTIANGTYRFIDSDDDVEISGTWFGSGTDTGDKGLYKAITGGIKYVLNTNFLIPTGDDPEKDDSDNGKPPVTPPKPPYKLPVKPVAGKPIVDPDPDLKLKNDLIKKHNGVTEAAKKEYEQIIKNRNKGEELDADTDKYFKDKFDINETLQEELKYEQN